MAGSNRRSRFCRPGGRPLPYGTCLALRVGFEPTSPGLETGILPLDERSGLAGILGFEPSASGLTDRPDHPGRLTPRDCWSGKPDSNRSSSRWKREILSHWTMPANWCRPEGSNPDISGFSGAPGPPRPERHFALGCGGRIRTADLVRMRHVRTTGLLYPAKTGPSGWTRTIDLSVMSAPICR